jgi:hypothetical protein
MKFFNFFLLLWVIFALLDPDLIGVRIRIRNPGYMACPPHVQEQRELEAERLKMRPLVTIEDPILKSESSV